MEDPFSFTVLKTLDIAGTVSLFKGRVLPFIGHRTSAIYHAADSLIERVDSIQRHFLDRLGITERDALFDYGLAPVGGPAMPWTTSLDPR